NPSPPWGRWRHRRGAGNFHLSAPPRSLWTTSGIESGTHRDGIVGRMSVDPRVDIGHVHLHVADIDRSLAFYRDILGFDVMQRIGDEAAFLSAGGYHHHLGLNTWDSRGGPPPPPHTARLSPPATRHRPPRPVSTTSRSATPTARSSATRSSGWSTQGGRSAARPITASPRRSTSATPTGIESSSICTGQ